MPPLPEVFTVADALRHGLTRHQVATRVRRRVWVRLRRGTFCLASTWEAADARGRHLLHCAAAVLQHPDLVLSHLSAAAAWRWPLPLDGLTDVWLTASSGAGASARRRSGLLVDAAPLPLGDVVGAASRPRVTARARTVADCLRRCPLEDAVAVADAALREGVTRQQVVAALEAQAGWPYVQRATTALPLVDGRRESWLESYSVVRLWQRGVPLPEPQATVRDECGRFIGRVDLWWREWGVVGEADGREKYRRSGLASVSDVERLLREEKRREDALRDAGLQVVRYGTADAVRGIDDLVERVQRARRRGDPERVRAVIRVPPK